MRINRITEQMTELYKVVSIGTAFYISRQDELGV